MNYPIPYWSLFTPTLPLSDYLNYWNRYTQEERIKRICEELWKLIQAYQLLTDAVNDLDERITTLETRMTALETQMQALIAEMNALTTRVSNLETSVSDINTRLTDLEAQVTQLVNDLPSMVQSIIDNYIDSPEFTAELTALVNSLITGKMDKVPSATLDHIATYDSAGQVKDSGSKVDDFITKKTTAVENDIATFDATGSVKDSSKQISVDVCTFDSDDTDVPTSKAVYRSIIRFLTDTNMDNIPLRFGNYYLDSSNSLWTATVNGLVYSTNCIRVEAPINSQNVRVQSGWFKNPSNPTPVLMERYYNITGASWSSWQILSHEYIQSTEELAQSVSADNPTALVYVPEEV